MTKTKHFTAAKVGDSKTVCCCIEGNPDFVTLRDAGYRAALHVVASVPLSRRPDRAGESVASAKLPVASGADVNAIRMIPDGRELFSATPLLLVR